MRGWKVLAGAESKWKAANWNLKLASEGVQTGAMLWSDAEIANGEFIADVQIPKDADLSKPLAGFSVRGAERPVVIFGTGDAPIVFGADKVKPGKWYRLLLSLEGSQLKATLTEPQDANPQIVEANVDLPAKGPVGVADLGTSVTFANFFVRDAK